MERVIEVARLREGRDGVEVLRLDAHALQVRRGMHRRVIGVCEALDTAPNPIFFHDERCDGAISLRMGASADR